MPLDEGPLRGVLPVVVTPFAEDFSIDRGQLEHEVAWILDCGAAGVTVGMSSEILRLSTAERMQLAEVTCAAASGRGRSVIAVTAESTPLACELARQAETVGADAIMVNAPVLGAAPESELHRHFSRVIETTSLPVVIQDASGYAGRPLSVELHGRLFTEYPGRVAFKPESNPLGPKLSALHRITGGAAAMFEGSGGGALVEAFARGLAGTMPGPDLVWAIVPLWQALLRDDIDRAAALAARLLGILALATSLDAYIAIHKFLLVEQGVLGSDRMRPPVDFRVDRPMGTDLVRLLANLRAEVDTGMAA